MIWKKKERKYTHTVVQYYYFRFWRCSDQIWSKWCFDQNPFLISIKNDWKGFKMTWRFRWRAHKSLLWQFDTDIMLSYVAVLQTVLLVSLYQIRALTALSRRHWEKEREREREIKREERNKCEDFEAQVVMCLLSSCQCSNLEHAAELLMRERAQ